MDNMLKDHIKTKIKKTKSILIYCTNFQVRSNRYHLKIPQLLFRK